MGLGSEKSWSGLARSAGRGGLRTRTASWGVRKLGETAAVRSRRSGIGLAVALGFAILAAVVSNWSREQPLVAVGRVMDQTRLVRVGFSLEDQIATSQRKEEAKARTPRVYVADVGVLDELRSTLENLPKTVSGVEGLEQVEPRIRESFGLTPESLAALKGEAKDGEVGTAWMAKIDSLMNQLVRRPILDEQTWQRATLEGLHTEVELVLPERRLRTQRGEIVNAAGGEALRDAATIMAREAGIDGLLRGVVVQRLTQSPKPTYRLDEAATVEAQKASADKVQAVIVRTSPGQVIFARGEALSAQQFGLYESELAHFASDAPDWQLWTRRMSVLAACGAVTLALAGYAGLFVPKLASNPARMVGAAALLLGMLTLACVGTALQPERAAATVVLPTVFVGIILVIAYDQRVALAFSVLHGTLVCLALDQGIGTMAVILTGVGTAVVELREIRDRNTLLRMGVVVGVALALATGLVSLVNRPIGLQVIRETVGDAALAGAGALMVAGLTMFILPLVEKGFGITTGMTLIELRDPRHPLLRELQTSAPGTYNHSLNVASIAEAAADAIGGDGLLAYVGALYHDVGKSTKPAYFVENQYAGANKHDRLTPAMSLLVVVGHVKDGIELARRFGLPRTVQHFIESHHGTTLVEYFYHRAKQQAKARAGVVGTGSTTREQIAAELADPDAVEVPDEFEYRYPGPKPRTKEAAILMIADACESASRSLIEPTPSRIEALVRGISRKRLDDGQFDDCEITLRDLSRISESVARTLSSIHHGRIAYPGDAKKPESSRPESGIIAPKSTAALR